MEVSEHIKKAIKQMKPIQQSTIPNYFKELMEQVEFPSFKNLELTKSFNKTTPLMKSINLTSEIAGRPFQPELNEIEMNEVEDPTPIFNHIKELLEQNLKINKKSYEVLKSIQKGLEKETNK
ncbi:MAG: hypothetical protein OXC61_07725 [Flavobacteriaceae bacterium]|nr:hypothetical protein [Flavobacteriaceae bacterium]